MLIYALGLLWMAWGGLLTTTARADQAAAEGPFHLIGLADDNTLVVFSLSRLSEARSVRISRLRGTLIGIDRRQANGRMYGVSSTNDIYTIDPSSGVAALVGTLTVPFDGGPRSGVDFNPQSDRLRIVGSQGQNLRVHPDLGAAAVDGAVAYAKGDRNFGRRTLIAAVAYTNSVKGATVTKTFDIDAALDVLVLQEPPNDGTLSTVGPLGVDFDARSGFDIATDGRGRDSAFAVSGSNLYAIDLGKGTATSLGAVGSGGLHLIGLVVMGPEAGPPR